MVQLSSEGCQLASQVSDWITGKISSTNMVTESQTSRTMSRMPRTTPFSLPKLAANMDAIEDHCRHVTSISEQRKSYKTQRSSDAESSLLQPPLSPETPSSISPLSQICSTLTQHWTPSQRKRSCKSMTLTRKASEKPESLPSGLTA
jgi:hypothetical protein